MGDIQIVISFAGREDAPKHLEAMVKALQGVDLVQRAKGSVPSGPTVEDAPGAHVNERHGAHVTGLPL